MHTVHLTQMHVTS